MHLHASAYQFLSRRSIGNQLIGVRRSSPKQRPDILFELTSEVIDRPFETSFAQLPPTGPSIGADQFIEDATDVYMSRRWPKCLSLSGTVDIPRNSIDEQCIKDILDYLRLLLWTPLDSAHAGVLAADQRAAVAGYRREYFNQQMFDIDGNRRPSGGEFYVATEVGDPIGPGVAALPERDSFKGINELVWTQILPFPDRKNRTEDLPAIRESVAALRKHYNGYNELQDAHRLMESGETTAAVRSAASAVDVILQYYCNLWSVAIPRLRLSFDEKIEHVLKAAGRSSYRSIAPDGLENLRNLYQCRSKSLHEGECYFRDRAGARVEVRTVAQVLILITAVEEFVLWIDALA